MLAFCLYAVVRSEKYNQSRRKDTLVQNDLKRLLKTILKLSSGHLKVEIPPVPR